MEQLAPNVWVAGFADKHGSANCSWIRRDSDTLLIDLPRGVPVADFLAEVHRISGKPVREVLHLTSGKDDAAIVAAIQEKGVKVSVPSTNHTHWLPAQRILFAGPEVVNGPRAPLKGTDTATWITRLEALEKLAPKIVVPGRGAWGDASLLARQKRYLQELRRQIAYGITMGRSVASVEKDLLLPASYYTWMPYDNPTQEDVRHVYSELTTAPKFDSPRPRALVLIGDRFHEPEHLERGLRMAFQTAKVAPHFTVDINQLNAQNLEQVDLLVILRDGMLWPDGPDKPYKIWMTPEQEQSVVQFVNSGRAFLNLHNSMGLYPENGPYLNLVGGRYIGHGPLERFRVEVVDKNHPITSGVSGWSAADEQHTPPYDKQKVHLLLENRSDEGQTAAAGWCYQPGKGRLVHLASGHTREALEHPMYQRLIVNSIRWLLKQ
ncbi:MAG: ThuA domain-containing protein [Bryobacterales bacterium]|nr:ThuA domain-containing protein [Bryobacterales bacterium]